ncbi:MAG: class I SAM-dependent methyltransferase [Gammaproteobacteria bacterium]|nr:class I SAM-dependent methyltransferase [Gammaproteobacteria bacterium]
MSTLYKFPNFNIEVRDELALSKPELETFFQSGEKVACSTTVAPFDLVLGLDSEDRFSLHWNKAGEKKPIVYELDFIRQIRKLRSFPAPKQGAFNQALGNKTKTVLDTTGGWGGDAMLMAAQGYTVTILERNPLMALLLSDAFAHLKRYVDTVHSPLRVPVVKFLNAIDALSGLAAQVDCVYVDPMFPPKKKKSAATNKQMQLLQWMVGEDEDASRLVQQAITHGAKRICVKRPDYAEPLFRKSDQQFSSKLVHYDVYFAN